ncbi:MAG TPA: TlpA disulfide reductase family protein [Myxococcota bacterium]|nr:TlpA disulfide reductase family protein [Myxococcota bacterium]
MLWYLFGCVPHAPSFTEPMGSPAPPPEPVAEKAPSSSPEVAAPEGFSPLVGSFEAPPPLPVGEEELARLLQNPQSRPVVLNFWATWCAPCVKELPYLERLAEQFREVSWILVNVDGANPTAVHRWLDEHPVLLPQLLLDSADPAGVLARQVPAWEDAIPLTLVVHPGGAVHAVHQGALQPGQLEASLLSLGNPRICAQHGL